MSLKAILSALGLMSIAIPCFYSQQQPPHGVLKGTVRDQTLKLAIGGAKVQVLNAAGVVRGTARTGKDGTYLVSGLVLGEKVDAVCSAAGYAPDPWSHPLTISKREIIQDVDLLCDCQDAAYWKTWADNQNVWAKTLSKDPSLKARLLDESWRALGYIGISAEARGSAASSLVAVEPITGKFPVIVGFAKTDPMVLRKTEERLRVTLNGGIAEDVPAVSPEIAAEIAAVEVRKKSRVEGKESKFVLDNLDSYTEIYPHSGHDTHSTWGMQTKKCTIEIIGKDADMKNVIDRVAAVK